MAASQATLPARRGALESLRELVVFRLEEQRCALPLERVGRIVPAAEITPLPNAPPTVRGIIDFHGQVLPVLDPRDHFGLPPKELTARDHLLLAHTAARDVLLLIDEALEVIDMPAAGLVPLAPDLPQMQGVVQGPDGLVIVYDLDRFLSPEEERHLEEALSQETAHAS